jgi:diguanylate cyclase (GGDEF)-like protein
MRRLLARPDPAGRDDLGAGDDASPGAVVRTGRRDRARTTLEHVDRHTVIGFALLAVIASLLAVIIHSETERRRALALTAYIRSTDEEARAQLQPIEQLFEHVYEDLRTLAALPGVRNVDRHGISLAGDSRETFQQIYNNLADAVAVSEVYVIPGDFDPERIDPVTGELEEPIVMFDELIVDAASRVDEELRDELVEGAHEEIEIHEYREFAKQTAWMAASFPRRDTIEGLDVPMIGSPSLITCDNTYYMHSGADADRMGILLSVPFYAPSGEFKGLVSAIVLDRALAAVLPSSNAVLFNQAYGYSNETDVSDVESSRMFFAAGLPDPHLLFSETYRLDVSDPRGPWTVWSGRPDAEFNSSPEAQAARTFEVTSLGILAVLTVLAGAIWGQFRRQRRAAERHARELESKVAARTDEIARLALTDPLTDLPNRAMMRMHMEQIAARAAARTSFAVLCVDLDRLKLINDTLGHAAGDTYLVKAADRMRTVIGSRGAVARWGGDEFVITLEGHEAAAQAQTIAGEVLAALSEDLHIEGSAIAPGCSIGIAVAPHDAVDAEDLLNRADRALYRAKAEGRGRVARYDPVLDEISSQRRRLEHELRVAIEERQFVVHYQPMVDAQSGDLVGFEALVRWEHPELGLMLPAEFIPVAEDTGCIVEIGAAVLEDACRAACTWPDHLRIAVNLSPVQVSDERLPQRVEAVLRSTGLRPERLELELTESVLLDASQTTLDRIAAIRRLGVRVALDDFGTGYCSLGYLQDFAFDRIKIDRTFVAELTARPTCIAIVRAVTQLARSLGMHTTAEGVETHEQADLLARNGVTDLQGYLHGRPFSAEAARTRAWSPIRPAAAPDADPAGDAFGEPVTSRS